jgi:hypothetical protein
MVVSAKPPANAFVAFVRKIYNPLGFQKGYNFVLFFIFAGGLMGFTLARLQYLDFDNRLCVSGGAAPGECYYYRTLMHEKVGIIMHLGTILPAGLLVVFQFLPVIRHKFITFHRVNGYLILLLSVLSTVGALMISQHSFGGGLDMQLGAGVASAMFLVSLGIAYYNIKRLQIEQHRAWMLRAWFYVSFSPTPYVQAEDCANVTTYLFRHVQ